MLSVVGGKASPACRRPVHDGRSLTLAFPCSQREPAISFGPLARWRQSISVVTSGSGAGVAATRRCSIPRPRRPIWFRATAAGPPRETPFELHVEVATCPPFPELARFAGLTGWNELINLSVFFRLALGLGQFRCPCVHFRHSCGRGAVQVLETGAASSELCLAHLVLPSTVGGQHCGGIPARKMNSVYPS